MNVRFRGWFRPAPALLLAIPLVTFEVSANDPLGALRLFLTAEDRAELNDLRSGAKPVIVPVVVEVPEPEPEPKPKPRPRPKPKPKPLPSVTLQGYVSRSDGQNNVWVNGRPVEEGQQASKKVRVLAIDDNGGTANIHLPDQSTLKLKPGQRFDPAAKRVVDPLD